MRLGDKVFTKTPFVINSASLAALVSGFSSSHEAAYISKSFESKGEFELKAEGLTVIL